MHLKFGIQIAYIFEVCWGGFIEHLSDLSSTTKSDENNICDSCEFGNT
jgi:hypothetical protein